MKEQKTLTMPEAEPREQSIKPEVAAAEKRLVVLEGRPKRRIDETISTPEKYVSRYHYETKNIDAELELCPHCKKPTFSAFRKIVADSAMSYLLEKEQQRTHRYNRWRNGVVIGGALALISGLCYWLLVVSAGKI